MPCSSPVQIVQSIGGKPVGLPTAQITALAVYIDGFAQQAPKGFKIPSCYFDLSSLASAVGGTSATYNQSNGTVSLTTQNNTTVQVMTVPSSLVGTGSPTVVSQPPITTQYIGGGDTLLTSTGEFLPVNIGGKVRLIPLFTPK